MSPNEPLPESGARPEVSVSTTRAKAMHASDPALGALSRLPQWSILAGLGVLMIVGIVVRGIVGAVVFGLVSAFLAWLLYISWPQLRPIDRLARAAVLVLTVGVTIVLAVPR